MKIPDSVRIAGIEYPVETVDWLNDGTNIAYGHIDFDNCKIELSGTIEMGHEKKCHVLWHEILHGIIENSGMKIENEEEIVKMFAKGIYQVLQDNGRRFYDIKDGD